MHSTDTRLDNPSFSLLLMATYNFLVRLLCLAFVATQTMQQIKANACTRGFIQQDLLKKRAEKISTTNSLSVNQLDNELRVVTGLTFTCSGALTSLQLGADLRAVTANRNQYPEVQIWRYSGPLQLGAFRPSSSREEIRLTAGDFSPDGVLQYNLTAPIQFQSGDFMGIFQPAGADSAVRLFFANDTNAPSANLRSSNSDFISVVLGAMSRNEHMLLSAITDPPGCTGASFLTPEVLRQKTLEVNINRVVVRDRQQRVFPDISFTCNGSITKWIVGAGTGGGSSPSSELQIWRRSGTDSYTKVASTQLTAQSPINNSNVYEYVPSSPLGFQEGDILGVYQREDSSVVPYHQEFTGPRNLRQSGEHDFAADSVTAPVQADEYDYPLLTVEIGPPLSTSISPVTTSVTQNAITFTQGSTADVVSLSVTSSLASFPGPSPTIGGVVEGKSSQSDNGSPLSTSSSIANEYEYVPSSQLSFQERDILATIMFSQVKSTFNLPSITPDGKFPVAAVNNTTTIIIVVTAVTLLLVVMFLTAIVVLVVSILLKRRSNRKNGQLQVNEDNIMSLKDLANPIYSNDDSSIPTDSVAVSEYYEPLTTSVYYTPGASVRACIPTYYEQPMSSLCQQQKLKWGIVVPTMAQRRNALSKRHYEVDEELYSALANDEGEYQELQSSFFQDTVIYWEPGSDCASIYEQLAKNKFREIIREQIRIVDHLGSGQFGWVDKGVWTSPAGSTAVAIKMLRDGASEEEKVKFLQEAAIMGQFHHPNIVKLHGVVTVGEPTLLVLELMNGDLQSHLQEKKPIPGEMVPSSLPQQLLGYCRQIASGMEYLSKKSFVHRDLAARNILVDDKRTCKIGDFGLSRDLMDDNYYVSHGGKVPIKWTSPEAINFKKYSTASDVWSFGVLMYEIWSLGHKPFEGKTNNECVDLIDSNYRLPPPPGCTRKLYQIMIECWHPETSGRPSFANLVSRLSQPENQLLKWTDVDKSVTHPQSTMLGAPLETASDLHFDLQQQYS